MPLELSIKAILIGCASYGALLFLQNGVISISPDMLQSVWFTSILSLFATCSFPACGYITGAVARHNAMGNAIAVGALIGIASTFFSVANFGEAWHGASIIGSSINFIVTCIIMCGFGGALSRHRNYMSISA